jgi:hypothetical protein
MNRRWFILLHLYASAFFTAAVALMALSGSLYLLDIKGAIDETPIGTTSVTEPLTTDAGPAQVAAVLAGVGVTDYRYDYLRGNDKTLYTRPSSRRHYRFDIEGQQVRVSSREPDLIAAIIELHKGHGPTAFRTFQKLLGAGLLIMVLSGAWLGLSAQRLRLPTAITLTTGALLVVLLTLV